MKILTILLVLAPLLVRSQQRVPPPTIFISAYKVVTVKIPDPYEIVDIKAGLETEYFTAKQVQKNLILLQATDDNDDLPVSNLTVFCDSAIFHMDIKYQREISQYYYELDPDGAIKISSSLIDAVSISRTAQTINPQATEVLIAPGRANTPEDTLYYNKDRLTLGISKNSVLGYVNNLAGSDEFINISLKIVNQSQVTFHSDAISWFIITKAKKKSKVTLGDDDDPIQFRPMNTFPPVVAPGQTALFVMQFRKFSLASDNSLKLVIGEGQGRRNISFEIKSKTFYKSIKYYEN